MPKIKEEGTHTVTIRGGSWEETKNGTLVAILPGFTENGEHINARLMMSDKIRGGSDGDGKTWMEYHLDNLEKMGFSKKTYDLAALDGSKADFVCSLSDDYGMQVDFVNPPRPKVSASKASAYFARHGIGKAIPEPEPEVIVPEVVDVDIDDIPF